MDKEKILSIIKAEGIFTVKSDNNRLMKIVDSMKELQLKDIYKDYYYYGFADQRSWSLKNGYHDE